MACIYCSGEKEVSIDEGDEYVVIKGESFLESESVFDDSDGLEISDARCVIETHAVESDTAGLTELIVWVRDEEGNDSGAISFSVNFCPICGENLRERRMHEQG